MRERRTCFLKDSVILRAQIHSIIFMYNIQQIKNEYTDQEIRQQLSKMKHKNKDNGNIRHNFFK